MDKLIEILPNALSDEIQSVCDVEKIDEIRIRKFGASSLTLGGTNLRLHTRCTDYEMTALVKNICGGSLYAHSETLKQGYIAYGGGMRVGVCGRAVFENMAISAVTDISSLNIRIPRYVCGAGEYCEKIFKGLPHGGILIYSKPSEGKTTILRDLAKSLSSGILPRRVAVVDTRFEIYMPEIFSECTVDFLSGYPKAEGIELALRTLSPQVIICDEIGNVREAVSMISSSVCGTTVIASAHGDDAFEIVKRGGISEMHAARVFGAYIGVSRNSNGGYNYQTNFREEWDG